MATAPAAQDQIDAFLAANPGWRVEQRVLRRSLVFADFRSAFGFMTQGALAAEALGHHPDWSNSWATVEISLSTHSAGGAITALDLHLAAEFERIAAPLLPA